MSKTIRIRAFEDTDDVEELTRLIHLAYAPLGERGYDFNGVNQSAESTAQRVRQGVCLVAEMGSQLVGTYLLHGPFEPSEVPCAFLSRADVAYGQQFAIHPTWQRLGVGSQLIRQAEALAKAAGYRVLAMDTAANVAELVQYYFRLGFEAIEHVQWPGQKFLSLVLAKDLASGPDT